VSEKLIFNYVTYIHASAEQVWKTLTDPVLSAEFWSHSNVSDWAVGSTWQHVRTDGSGIADVVGVVLDSTPPFHIVITYGSPDPAPTSPPTHVTFLIEPWHDIVRVSVWHEDFVDHSDYDAAAAGWPAVMSNLKTRLETGRVLPQAPWEMGDGLTEEQRAEQATA
jgi:uncharacterized protein YndB with AHSA1/START domain